MPVQISVVVPVYNAEKYIDRCVGCIEAQDFRDWELLLVDDGSTDATPGIVDGWAGKDTRIRAIHQENSGPGAARNRGIREATGDFIVFIDSDDLVDPGYFSLLAEKTPGADLVFIDTVQVDPDGVFLRAQKISDFRNDGKDRITRAQMTGMIPWGGVRKAVRRSLLVENGIGFSGHAVGEEALYSLRLMLCARNIAFIDERPVYSYVVRRGSQSESPGDDPWGGAAKEIKEFLETGGLIGSLGNTWNSFSAAATLVSVDRISGSGRRRRDIRAAAKERIGRFRSELIPGAGFDKKNTDRRVRLLLPFLRTGQYLPVIWVCRFRRALHG